MDDILDTELLESSALDVVGSFDSDLLARPDSLMRWMDRRLASGVDSYSKFTAGPIGPRCRVGTRDGRLTSGINLASQDYLNLSSHPAVREAAKAAIDRYGVHSGGSAALMGNSELSRALEARLARFLGMADCTVFPTGWGAGYGVITTLVDPDDHVVIDMLAHACLQEGARNATSNVHTVPHLSNDAVERRLVRIRRDHPRSGILVVTETLFSMDSDVPALRELQAICRAHGATLLVDAAHDIGAIGASGRGMMEAEGMVGDGPDILIGSFSKTFASNGGYVASRSTSLKLALRYRCGPLTFTNALSPVQCAVVLAALDVVESVEGAERRARLMANAGRLRDGLAAAGFKLLGRPSAVVPAILGDNAMSRLMTRATLAEGAIVNLVEYPAVPRTRCRWRLQVMADHAEADLDAFVAIAVSARAAAEVALGTARPSSAAA